MVLLTKKEIDKEISEYKIRIKKNFWIEITLIFITSIILLGNIALIGLVIYDVHLTAKAFIVIISIFSIIAIFILLVVYL
jgi:hypothetical protein